MLPRTALRFLLIWILATYTHAGPYEDGAIQFERGNFSKARGYWSGLEKTDARVQYYLGYMYQRGLGVPKDDSVAAKWYQLAADQGFPDAQASLGYLYLHGFGVKKDELKSLGLLRAAAESGYVHAQSRLCAILKHGLGGIAPDWVEAMKWARLAAEQGDAFAQCRLGVALFYGTGVERNRAEGIRWCIKAAEQVDVQSMYQLGLMHDDLRDRASLVNAWGWYRLAADEGYTAAKRRLKFLGRFLTKDEIRVGEAQARDFKKKMRRPETSVSR